MKKSLKTLSIVLASTLVLAACNNDGSNTDSSSKEAGKSSEETSEAASEEPKEEEKEEDKGTDDGTIHVYSRDPSSGTRSAFQEIVGFGDTEGGQEPLTDKAAIVDSNGDMAVSVSQDNSGIGYVSLSTDFEKNGITPLSYEGVEPKIDTVLDGSYTLKRPFNYVSRADGDFENDETQELVEAFLDFLNNSVEGRQVVVDAGAIADPESGTFWDELKANHPIVEQDNKELVIRTAGSTSVEEAVKAALEAFQPLAGNFQFILNQTGSGDGYKRVLGGEKDGANAADIGFASREFKDEEDVSKGLDSGSFAQDAVVLVVAEGNDKVENLSNDDILAIFTGQKTKWSEIGK